MRGPFRSYIPGILVLTMSSSAAEPQQPSNSPGIISGRVMSADGRTALPRARITATAGQRETTVQSDADGKYELHVAPGRYWVRAEREHWLNTYFGQRLPTDTPESILVEAGTRRGNADIFMIRLGI